VLSLEEEAGVAEYDVNAVLRVNLEAPYMQRIQNPPLATET
jgi:hypothetical protein